MKRRTTKQIFDALDKGMCGNGCNKPIAPPSKVVCQDCLDVMGEELREMLLKFEDTNPHEDKPPKEEP